MTNSYQEFTYIICSHLWMAAKYELAANRPGRYYFSQGVFAKEALDKLKQADYILQKIHRIQTLGKID